MRTARWGFENVLGFQLFLAVVGNSLLCLRFLSWLAGVNSGECLVALFFFPSSEEYSSDTTH